MTYEAEILAESPAAYWRLNDATTTLEDATANNRDGTYAGAVTRQAASLLPDDGDASADFAGGKVTVPYGAWMEPSSWTLEFLIRADVIDGNQRFVIGRHAGGGAASWDVLVYSGVLDFRFYGWNSLSTPISAGVTYHVACVRNGGFDRKLYVNGNFVGTVAGGHSASSAPLTIGDFDFSGGSKFDGRLDEISFIPTALPEATIIEHATAAGTRVPPPPPPEFHTEAYEAAVLADSPVAYYPMDETSLPFASLVNGHSITQARGAIEALGPDAGAKFADDRAVTSHLFPEISQYTFECWYKGSGEIRKAVIVSARGGKGGLSVWVSGAPVNGGPIGTVHVGVSAGSVWTARRTDVTVTDGNWHHIVGILDTSDTSINAADFDIYIDGVLADTVDSHYSGTSLGGIGGSAFSIGENTSEDGPNWLQNSQLAAMAFYPTALTAQQVLDHYEAAYASAAVSVWDGTQEIEATIEGWWDGSAVQPVEVEGWWDGSAVQPLA